MNKYSQKAAEELESKYSIGTWSRFCDEPADFDSAETKDIADLIETHAVKPAVEERDVILKQSVSAMREALPHYKISAVMGDLGSEKIACILMKAITAAEKLLKS